MERFLSSHFSCWMIFPNSKASLQILDPISKCLSSSIHLSSNNFIFKLLNIYEVGLFNSFSYQNYIPNVGREQQINVIIRICGSGALSGTMLKF